MPIDHVVSATNTPKTQGIVSIRWKKYLKFFTYPHSEVNSRNFLYIDALPQGTGSRHRGDTEERAGPVFLDHQENLTRIETSARLRENCYRYKAAFLDFIVLSRNKPSYVCGAAGNWPRTIPIGELPLVKDDANDALEISYRG